MKETIDTITVDTLRKLLDDQDPNMRVVFTSSYGDRVATPQAHFIDGELEEGYLVPTAYSVSGYKVTDDPDEVDLDEPDEDPEPVLIIS